MITDAKIPRSRDDAPSLPLDDTDPLGPARGILTAVAIMIVLIVVLYALFSG